MIRTVSTQEDAGAIRDIYNHYIRETVITFETEELTEEEMAGRIHGITTRFPYLVYEEGGKVIGYAYANTWRVRSAYDQTVETTVYLDPRQTGKGIGRTLYQALLDECRARNLHIAVASIALPNEHSVKLHERMGFEKVAHFTEVGWKFDRWRDVGFWELKL